MGTHRADVEQVKRNLEQFGLLPSAIKLAKEYRVRLLDLLGESRAPTAAAARRHLWSLIRDSLNLSYPEIGRLTLVDHTTVMEAVRKRHAEINREHSA